MYEKLEKQSLEPFGDRPGRLLVRHSFSNSEVLGLLSHVIVVKVEEHMLPQLSLSRNCGVVSRFCSQLHSHCQSAEWYLTKIASHPGITTLLEEK